MSDIREQLLGVVADIDQLLQELIGKRGVRFPSLGVTSNDTAGPRVLGHKHGNRIGWYEPAGGVTSASECIPAKELDTTCLITLVAHGPALIEATRKRRAEVDAQDAAETARLSAQAAQARAAMDAWWTWRAAYVATGGAS
jgi:hypothetical protein